MNSLTVRTNLGLNAEDSLVQVEVIPIDSESDLVDGTATGNLPFVAPNLKDGRYLVRAKLPNGSYNQQHIAIRGKDGEVVIESKTAGNEDLNLMVQNRAKAYAIFDQAEVSMKSTTPISAKIWQGLRPVGEVFPLSLLDSNPTLTPFTDARSGVIGRYSISSMGGGCISIDTPTLTRWIAIPPQMRAQAVIFHKEGAPDGIAVSMSGFHSQMESLTSLLQSRTYSVGRDRNMMEELGLLRKKYENPSPAVVAAYVILRSNPEAMNLSWLENLCRDFRYADSYLIAAKLATRIRWLPSLAWPASIARPTLYGRSVDQRVTLGILEEAFANAPFPMLTEGYRLLQEILHSLDETGEDFDYGKNPSLLPASVRSQVRLFPLIDWRSRYTTFLMPRGKMPEILRVA